MFAVFVDEQHAEGGTVVPPKPKPRYSRKIRNSGGISTEHTGMMLFQNNLEAEAQLAGYGFLPPTAINATVNAVFTSELPPRRPLATALSIMEASGYGIAADRDNLANVNPFMIV